MPREKKKNVLKWDIVGLNSVSALEHSTGILRRKLLGEEDFCPCWGRRVRETCFASARVDRTFVRDHG